MMLEDPRLITIYYFFQKVGVLQAILLTGLSFSPHF
jgi:hypothetical protein